MELRVDKFNSMKMKMGFHNGLGISCKDRRVGYDSYGGRV